MGPEVFDLPGEEQAQTKYINFNRLLGYNYDCLVKEFILIEHPIQSGSPVVSQIPYAFVHPHCPEQPIEGESQAHRDDSCLLKASKMDS